MEDFVSFEIAKKLKEKGFKEKCFVYYNDNDIEYNYESPMFNNEMYISHNSYDNIWHRDYIDAPTISQVLKWLREEKKISIEVSIHCSLKWMCSIYEFSDDMTDYTQYNNNNNNVDDTVYILYDSYESATLAGIEYVLDNLI